MGNQQLSLYCLSRRRSGQHGEFAQLGGWLGGTRCWHTICVQHSQNGILAAVQESNTGFPAGCMCSLPVATLAHSLSAKPAGSFSRSVRVRPAAACPLDTSPVCWPERVRGEREGEGPKCRERGLLEVPLLAVELRLALLPLPRPTSCDSARG